MCVSVCGLCEGVCVCVRARALPYIGLYAVA